MKAITLVVIYNKKIEDSTTIKSLLLSNYTGDLYIFNNGPSAISVSASYLELLQGKYSLINIIEDVSNRPLSTIYNDFLNTGDYDYYYLFDDDTTIPSNFFAAEQQIEYDLSLPIIVSAKSSDVVYPIVNNKVFHEREFPFNESDEVISIGSGLMVNKSLILKFEKIGLKPFDERFALYGVDYSLFRRLPFLKRAGYAVRLGISGTLHHSLSSEENHISAFRKRERLIDIMLTKLHYSRRKGPLQLLSILKTLAEHAVKSDFQNFKMLLEVCLHREHPRSTQYRNRLKNHNNIKFDKE
ncbi:glycosyltransferase family 2 protein [Klebsiella pasteurii]|uniref:glycosyltransferase family 2 protein n=1 Tax=Klebsiella pasteurii TaxID=2587529 RepID=UPI001C7D358B|nr:hypothetical protein [Klebsiella pasteurii]